MALFGLVGRPAHERSGFALYTAAVKAARDPVYFERLGVPDTLDGRFDLVGLFVAIMIRRLRALPAPGPALAQASFDAMFADMDFNLRELGVGDLSIGKRVKAMWEAFHGRALAYEGPLSDADAETLALALARNVWRGAGTPEAALDLAHAALAQDACLAAQSLTALTAGTISFLAADQALPDINASSHTPLPPRDPAAPPPPPPAPSSPVPPPAPSSVVGGAAAVGAQAHAA